MYIHTQKSIENKKITFLENVKKIKNIPIKGGGSPYSHRDTRASRSIFCIHFCNSNKIYMIKKFIFFQISLIGKTIVDFKQAIDSAFQCLFRISDTLVKKRNF